MKTIFKRTVAAFLTAGALLTGITACDDSEDKEYSDSKEYLSMEAALFADIDSFLAINPDNIVSNSTELDKVVYFGIYGPIDKELHLGLICYDKEGDIDNPYVEIDYIVPEEYSKHFDMKNNHYGSYFPFENQEEELEIVKYLIENNSPNYFRQSEVPLLTKMEFDQIVEEYCK